MNIVRRLIAVGLCTLMPMTLVTPSWARGGFGWGWWLPAAVAVSVAANPWWYSRYPYDPYYYGPSYPYPYYPPPPAPPQAAATSPDNPRLTEQQIAQTRERVEYDYADGDISKSERDARMATLDRLAAKASELAPVSPGNSRRDLTAVNDLQMELNTLLEQKLKDAQITQAQRDGEARFLDRLKVQAQTQAGANGDFLTTEQEESLVRQLHHAYYVINHNFIGD